MKRFMYFILTIVIVYTVGCSTTIPDRVATDIELSSTPPTAASPLVYVKVLKKKEHSDFAKKVSRANIPIINIADAIQVTFPFSVNVVPDASVNLERIFEVKISNPMTVKHLLKYLAAISGFSLNYIPENKSVYIATLETKTWHFPTLVGRSNVQVSLGQSDSTDGENRAMQTDHATDQNVEWDAIVEQVRCLVGTPGCEGVFTVNIFEASIDEDEDNVSTAADSGGSDGSSVTTHKDQGLITVSTTPQKMKRLDAWLGAMEKNLNRFVSLQVALITISHTDDQQRGLDINQLLLEHTSNDGDTSKFGFDRINDLTTGGLLTLTNNLVKGDLKLNSVLKLISQKADLEVVHQANLVVAAGETATINSIEEFHYVSGQNTSQSDGGNVTSTNIEAKTVGIELALTPRFMGVESDLISLRIIPSISALLGDQPSIVLGDGTTAILPRIAVSDLAIHTLVRNNQAVVVGGLTKQTSNLTENGLPGGKWTALFDSTQKVSQKEELVIIVLAQEIEA